MKTFIYIEIFLFLLLAIGLAFAQEQKIQLVFNETMDRSTLFNINNYNLYDNQLNEVGVNRIGVAQGDSIVILYTPFLSYKTNFIVRVANVKDKAGNLINPEHNFAWFYVDGFDSTQVAPKLFFVK